ncbi:MAG: hypothetical protein RI911_596 [Candidatus Parcubacteria bacterium]|jgi:hypothetical protein
MNSESPSPQQPRPIPVWGESFSLQEAFTTGWETFIKHWQLFLVLHAATSCLLLVADWCVAGTLEGTLPRLIATVLDLGLKLIIGLGLLFVYLRVHDGEHTEPLDIFDPLPLFWGYAGVMVLYIIAVGVGLVALVVPGIIIAAGWALAQYIVIETDKNPIDALKESWKLTNGHKRTIILFGAITFIINFIGFLLFGLGLLVTLPVTGVAYAHMYRYFVPKTTL